MAVALAITSLNALAADTDGDSQAGVTIGVTSVYAQNKSGYAEPDGYESEYVTGQTNYNFSAPCSNDFYITYSVLFNDSETTYHYNSGSVWFKDNITVTTGNSTGYTVQDKTYNVTLVDVPECFNVAIVQSGTTYNFYCAYEDFYSQKQYDGFSFTVCVHTHCTVYGSNISSWRTLIPPIITITHGLTGISSSNRASFYTSEHNTISHAIDDTDLADDVNGIWLKLVELNNRNAYTDTNNHLWTTAELLYYVYGESVVLHGDVTVTNGLLNTANNSLVSIESDLFTIIDYLSRDASGKASDASNTVTQAQTAEGNAKNSANTVINNLGGTAGFDTALSTISNNDISGFATAEAVPLGFWHNVGEWLLNYDNIGYVAVMLMSLMVFSLLIWLLAL